MDTSFLSRRFITEAIIQIRCRYVGRVLKLQDLQRLPSRENLSNEHRRDKRLVFWKVNKEGISEKVKLPGGKRGSVRCRLAPVNRIFKRKPVTFSETLQNNPEI